MICFIFSNWSNLEEIYYLSQLDCFIFELENCEISHSSRFEFSTIQVRSVLEFCDTFIQTVQENRDVLRHAERA